MTGKQTRTEEEKQLKKKGHKALVINLIFFAVLFGGMFLVTVTGFAPTAIIVFIIFVASLLYIYFS